MEFLQESLLLGIDVLVLSYCCKHYYSLKRTTAALKDAPQLAVDEKLMDTIKQEPDNRIKYAVIRGSVTPIGTPLRSAMSPSVTGVLQMMKLTEHRVARAVSGLWTEEQRLIHMSSNEVPFCLTSGKTSVEIVNGLSAQTLDMDTVYDHYEPSTLSALDHIFGFFSGIRQKGLQTTEEVLREGSFITAVGEIELDGNVIRLQPPPTGEPMFLTTATKNILLKRFEEAKSATMLKIILCGTISVALIGLIARKIYKRKKIEWEDRRIREQLEKSRAERRARTRQTVVNEDQRCVVCVDNPKEVICLPCGHVCLCENCAEKIKHNCPVCRTKIANKAAAFIT